MHDIFNDSLYLSFILFYSMQANFVFIVKAFFATLTGNKLKIKFE